MSTLTAEPRASVQQAVQAPAPAKNVRILLSRTGVFTVNTPLLAAYLGNVIVREQTEHFIEDTMKWALAMFDVRCFSGGPAPRTAEQIAKAIDTYIEERTATTEHITLQVAMAAVREVLAPVYGKQIKIRGWMPGYRVAEGRTVLELSGDVCPECTVNPTGYRVGSTSQTEHCLNSEDCGWNWTPDAAAAA